MAAKKVDAFQTQKVDSSFIKTVGYNTDEKTLQIAFKGRPVSVINYYGVGAKTYQNLLNADSKGTFFNAKIKGKYSEDYAN